MFVLSSERRKVPPSKELSTEISNRGNDDCEDSGVRMKLLCLKSVKKETNKITVWGAKRKEVEDAGERQTL